MALKCPSEKKTALVFSSSEMAPPAAKEEPKETPAAPIISFNNPPESVVVHPLVLLSVVDHYNRVARNTKKRVVGVLLGQWTNGGKTVNIANSYAGKILFQCW